VVLYGCIISFLFGVFIFEYLDFSLLFLLFIISIYFLTYKKNLKLFLIISFFIFGCIRIYLVTDVNTAEYLVGKKIQYTGRIIKEPDKRENNIHYVVFVDDKNFKVRVTTPKIPEFYFNEEITFEGVLEKPKKFKNENEIEFDYPKFLAKDGIGYVMFNPKVFEKTKLEGEYFYSFLIFIKNKFSVNLQKELKNPESALAAGILIGSKQSLGKELLKDFRRAGLIHLVVLSGYNVTIIADAIRSLFSSLPIFYAKSFSIFFIISFCLLTGASATTIRASIMAVIAVLAFGSSRKYDVNRALWVAAFVMVIHNPKILTGDPGFQLSFVATLGLIHLSPLISKRISFITNKFQIREIIATTISTQIAVFPLIIKMTGELSVVAIFANILVLPIMPITMLLSALSGLFSIKTISFVSYFLLKYIIFIAEYFSNLSFAVVKIVFNNLPV
jgi:competence protein ComEC